MYSKIKIAEERLRTHANLTPIMMSRTLESIIGAHVFLKCENYQRVGAFKFRGAFNAISQLSDQEKNRGVITYSSGNHAQAVALVCKILGINATVVMPKNAPKIKRSATKEYGANIIEYNPEKEIREKVTGEIIKEKGFTLIPPYDHLNIVIGQGTAALELFAELKTLDMLLVPCGGGGLLSGSAIAAKGMDSACKVIGVEPEVADDAAKSFYTKTLHTVKNPPTIADGTRTPSLGKITFPLVLKYVDDFVTVTEQSIIEAVQFLFYRMKLVVEPSGALGIAALLSKKILPSGRVGVIISGGNIDAETMSMILNHKQE